MPRRRKFYKQKQTKAESDFEAKGPKRKCEIDKQYVDEARSLDIQWKDIAYHLDVHIKQLEMDSQHRIF